MTAHSFDIYGLALRVESHDAEVLDEVRRDFAGFVVPDAPPDLRVTMHLAPPPYDLLPPLRAAFLTPRNVCYRDGATSYVDYFGRGLVILDRHRNTCTAYSAAPGLLREMVYLFVLSTAGQHLDGRGLHRLHALGVARDGEGVLLLLPSGGGKTTMAMRLLQEPGFTLLSEDTPLIDRSGRVRAFPLCLGVRPGSPPPDVPARFLRTVERMEFDPKILVDLEPFGDRIAPPGETVEPGLLLIGERNLGTVSEIVPLDRARALKALTKYMVVGLGVYQGLEFLLERGTSELFGKGQLVGSRLYNAVRLLRRVPAYRFVLGRDRDANVETLLDFLAAHPSRAEARPLALASG